MNNFFNNTFLISQLQRLRSQNNSYNSEVCWNINNSTQDMFAKNLLLSNQFENALLNSKEFLSHDMKCYTPEISPKIIERQRLSNEFPFNILNRPDDNYGFPTSGLELNLGKLFPSNTFMTQDRNLQLSEEKAYDNILQLNRKTETEVNEMKNLLTDPDKTITARTFSNKISSNYYLI